MDPVAEVRTAAVAAVLVFVGLALGPVFALTWRDIRGRRDDVAGRQTVAFWCPLVESTVELGLATVGRFRRTRSTVVERCSAFTPPTALTCDRPCMDPAFRTRWLSRF
jgi:hypothetical protein